MNPRTAGDVSRKSPLSFSVSRFSAFLLIAALFLLLLFQASPSYAKFTVSVGPFTIEGDHAIMEAQWFGDVRVLAFRTGGRCAIFNCTEPPLRVTVNDQPYSNWMYVGLRGCLEIYDLSDYSAVKVFWSSPSSSQAPLSAAAIRVEAVSLGAVEAGAEKIFQIPVEFSGSSIAISRIEFKSYAGWFRVEESLPRTFTSSPESSMGRACINVMLRVPANATAGDIAVPVVVYAASPLGSELASQGLVSFTVSEEPQGIDAVKKWGSMLALIIALAAFLYYVWRGRL